MTRTVLITGGAGFIGSNLARRARRARRPGPDPRRPVDRPDRLSRRRARTSSSSARSPIRRRSARRSTASTRSSTSRHGPGSTIRSATRSGRSRRTWPGRSGVLDAARLAGVRRFVFASSNAAAGDHPPPSDETDLPHPLSPYGASKLADRGVLPGLRGDVRPGRLLAALLERLRAALAPQAQRRRGLAAGRPRRASRSRSTATASRPATSSTSTTSRRPSWPRSTRPRTTSPASCSRPGPGSRRPSTGWPTTIGRAVGRPLDDPSRTGAGRRRRAERRAGSTRPRAVLGYRAAVGARRGLAGTAAWFAARPRRPRAGRGRGPTRRRARSEPRRPMTATAPAPDVAPLDTPIARPVAAGRVAADARRAGHDRHPLRAGDPHLRHRHRPGPAARPGRQGPLRARPPLLAARRARSSAGGWTRRSRSSPGAIARRPGTASPTRSSGPPSSAASAVLASVWLYGAAERRPGRRAARDADPEPVGRRSSCSPRWRSRASSSSRSGCSRCSGASGSSRTAAIRVVRRGILLVMIVAVAAIARLSLDVALVLNLVALVVTRGGDPVGRGRRRHRSGPAVGRAARARSSGSGRGRCPARSPSGSSSGPTRSSSTSSSASAQTGIYSVTSGLAETLWYVPNALGTVMFSRAVDPKADAGRIAAVLTRTTLAVALVTAIPTFIFGPRLVRFVYGTQFADAGVALRLILPGIVAYSVVAVLSRYITGRGRPGTGTLILIAGLVVNIVINLVPHPALRDRRRRGRLVDLVHRHRGADPDRLPSAVGPRLDRDAGHPAIGHASRCSAALRAVVARLRGRRTRAARRAARRRRRGRARSSASASPARSSEGGDPPRRRRRQPARRVGRARPPGQRHVPAVRWRPCSTCRARRSPRSPRACRCGPRTAPPVTAAARSADPGRRHARRSTGSAGYLRQLPGLLRANRPTLGRVIARGRPRLAQGAGLERRRWPAAIAVRAGVPRFVWVAGSAGEVAAGRYRRAGAASGPRAVGVGYDAGRAAGRASVDTGWSSARASSTATGSSPAWSSRPRSATRTARPWPPADRSGAIRRLVWAGRLVERQGARGAARGGRRRAGDSSSTSSATGRRAGRLRGRRLRRCRRPGHVGRSRRRPGRLPGPPRRRRRVRLPVAGRGLPEGRSSTRSRSGCRSSRRVPAAAGGLADLARPGSSSRSTGPTPDAIVAALATAAGDRPDGASPTRRRRGTAFAADHTRPAEAARLVERWRDWWPDAAVGRAERVRSAGALRDRLLDRRAARSPGSTPATRPRRPRWPVSDPSSPSRSMPPPTLTVAIAVHDEADHIAERIDDALAQADSGATARRGPDRIGRLDRRDRGDRRRPRGARPARPPPRPAAARPDLDPGRALRGGPRRGRRPDRRRDALRAGLPGGARRGAARSARRLRHRAARVARRGRDRDLDPGGALLALRAARPRAREPGRAC